MFIVVVESLGLKTGACAVCSKTGTFVVLLWNVVVVVGVLSTLLPCPTCCGRFIAVVPLVSCLPTEVLAPSWTTPPLHILV